MSYNSKLALWSWVVWAKVIYLICIQALFTKKNKNKKKNYGLSDEVTIPSLKFQTLLLWRTQPKQYTQSMVLVSLTIWNYFLVWRSLITNKG